MLLEELVQRYTKVRNYRPSHVNELLDFIQKCYVFGELSIVDYKNFFFELNKLNAEKPSEFFIKTKRFKRDMEMPS
jgi:hypothetical protein